MRQISLALASLALASTLSAQDTTQVQHDSTVKRDSVAKLKQVEVVAAPLRTVTPIQALTLPVTASVTSLQADQTVNLIDVEDAVKYLPSVFLRKRNNGDTQAVMETRVWGVSSSARSLVFADGVPLTALVANNNNIGGPRWGLVSPEEISRIDMMYGPFSAAYAGNSMGAVMEITTRQPDELEASVNQTQSVQPFSLFGTNHTFDTRETAGHVGDRFGKFSYWLSGEYENSNAQPLSFVTSATFPSGTTGGFAQQSKLGAPANVIGASGMLHTGMTNGKVKLAYDITPDIRAAYTFGLWRNSGDAIVDSYLTSGSQPTFAGQSGFASGYYNIGEQHFAQSLSVRSDNRKGDWDFEAVGSLYDFAKDQQRTPTTVPTTTTFYGGPGRVAVLDGTGWSTLDLKGVWHLGGVSSATHTVSAGMHDDQYALRNPTFNTLDWRGGNFTSVASEGDGKTRTQALWAQDRWRITPAFALTLGARYESWRAFDGYNANGATVVNQPTLTDSKFSPKAVLSWTATADWLVTASLAKAYRFATASELYQLVTTGVTFTSPNPDLKPEDVLSAELRVQRFFGHGSAQVALFQDDVHDALIAQFLPLVAGSPTLYSFTSNVDHVRGRGVEIVLDEHDIAIDGLELSANGTYVDARTLALSGSASATAPAGAAVGKFLPNIPEWRGTIMATYRPSYRSSLSLAGRYASKMYTTLDNSDVRFNVYQGFNAWFVADARATYLLDEHWSAGFGVDNLFDRKYFLFHAFPQRTFVANLKYAF